MRIPTPKWTTAALALAVFGLGGPTASASQRAQVIGDYGEVHFQPYGDVLKAADLWPDGRGVRAYLRWGGTSSASVIDGGDLGADSRNLDIPEGTEVSLTMCYTKNWLDVKCSRPRTGEA